MKLNILLRALDKSALEHRVYIPHGVSADDIELSDLVCDSRKAGKGVIFAATKGGHIDAHDFIAKAAEAGAPAVLCERASEVEIPQIICPDVRAAMGYVASVLYGEPSKKMTMIALTGTNGKTTSTFMTQDIMNAAGIKCGLIGTIQYDDGSEIEEAEHTTPEGCDIQRLLARMAANGCGACVMEASSHSIVQGRINGLSYDRAGFTNLTPEHLDFHGDMEHYFAAKKKLFDSYMKNNWKACINVDDEYGRRLSKETGRRAVTYSVADEGADFFAAVKGITADGLELDVKTPESQKKVRAKLPLFGTYNVSNALQALSLTWSLGVSANTALTALAGMRQVPGRLERYRMDNGIYCVIDFAHTDDGMEKALSAVRPICKGKLIVVFGAGGDRDRAKRPRMGEVASRIGDFVVVTSDNPRSEDPCAIMADIEPGVKKHDTPYVMIPDRRSAIYDALDRAKENDIVVVAGRGPETHQILKDGPIKLVDKEIMADWCALRGRKVI